MFNESVSTGVGGADGVMNPPVGLERPPEGSEVVFVEDEGASSFDVPVHEWLRGKLLIEKGFDEP